MDERRYLARVAGTVTESKAPQLQHGLTVMLQVGSSFGQLQILYEVVPVSPHRLGHGITVGAGDVVHDEERSLVLLGCRLHILEYVIETPSVGGIRDGHNETLCRRRVDVVVAHPTKMQGDHIRVL